MLTLLEKPPYTSIAGDQQDQHMLCFGAGMLVTSIPADADDMMLVISIGCVYNFFHH